MRRLTSGIVAAIILFAGIGLFANPANAATTSRFEYTITSESPDLSKAPGSVECHNIQHWYPTSKQFEVVELEVSENGDYFFVDERNYGIDGLIIVFSSSFDPADVSNCLTVIDDASSVRLQAGITYSVVASSWGSPSPSDTYAYRVSGPGEAVFGYNMAASSVEMSPVRVDAETPAALVARPASSTLGADLSGAVTFNIDGSIVGTGTVSPSTGTATFDAGLLPVGTHAVTAEYSGVFGKTKPSRGETTVTVEKVVTTTTLTISPSAISAGENATQTAHVTGNSPTGSVEFYSGPTLVGISPVVDGVAQVTVSPDTGTYTVTASYSGDASYDASTSAPATLTVTEKVAPKPEPEPKPEPKPQATTKPESAQLTAKADAALANTGSTQDGWLAAAGLLLVAGTSVLILRKKSSR